MRTEFLSFSKPSISEDEIITPSMTWGSTVNLILLSGATPVFADIDGDILMVTRDSLESCVTEKPRLIIGIQKTAI